MSPSGADELIACGRIGRAHGVRGEVVVDPWTDTPAERFAAGAVLRTEGGGALTVESAREQSGRWVVGFAGLADRTAAEALRGTQLLVPRGKRVELTDPDEYYDTELVGLNARTAAGVPIGPVVEVVHGPGGDSLAIQGADREHLVPFVAALVPTVDVAAGVVVIDAPEGLLEL